MTNKGNTVCMKKIFPLAVLLMILATAHAQNGKYAGTKKSLIGKTYTDSRYIAGLKGWAYMEGALLNHINDPEQITAVVFKKGTTCVVIFSVKEDTASGDYAIRDVIEITGVSKGWSVRLGSCDQSGQPDPYIVAWGKDSQGAYMNLIRKAWRFDPDRRKVNAVPAKTVRCENIGC
jgi:hypothetical protein